LEAVSLLLRPLPRPRPNLRPKKTSVKAATAATAVAVATIVALSAKSEVSATPSEAQTVPLAKAVRNVLRAESVGNAPPVMVNKSAAKTTP